MGKSIAVKLGALCILAVIVFSANGVNAQTPVILSAVVKTETTVSLSWTISNDSIPNYEIIAGFELYMSSTGPNGPYSKVWSTLNNQQTSTYINDLSPDASYCFYIIATGLSGSYQSNTVQVIMSPNSTAAPSPTVPEFSPLAIVPLLLSMFVVAVILRHRKATK